MRQHVSAFTTATLLQPQCQQQCDNTTQARDKSTTYMTSCPIKNVVGYNGPIPHLSLKNS